MLKQPGSIYRPGERSPAWLKLKPKLTLEVVVIGGSATRIPWGDWGEAVNLELDVRVLADRCLGSSARPSGSHARSRSRCKEQRAELVCWGVMPSGMLRHPLFLRWLP